MSSELKSNNYALLGAVLENDSDEVAKFLAKGADPNYYCSKTKQHLIEIAIVERDRWERENDSYSGIPYEETQLLIVKLLLKYGAELQGEYSEERGTFEYLFQRDHNEHYAEFVEYILKYKKDAKFIQKIFWRIAFSPCRGSSMLKAFQILLDHGLPMEEFIVDFVFRKDNNYSYGDSDEESDEECDPFSDNEYTGYGYANKRRRRNRSNTREKESLTDRYTALHVAVQSDRADWVKLLLERGADVHKKTALGLNCLGVLGGEASDMIKLLMTKGLQINSRFFDGKTALHRACIEHNESTIHSLFRYGADPNILDDDKKPPLLYSKIISRGNFLQSSEKAMIKELAKFKFDNKPICEENLKYINNDEKLKDEFDECLQELKKLNDHIFYSDMSLANVVTQKHFEKLINLAKNADFIESFKSCKKDKWFCNYQKCLDANFKDILERRNIAQAEL